VHEELCRADLKPDLRRRLNCQCCPEEALQILSQRWARSTHARATETFPNEREAKKFARAKSAENQNVSAGTLNPHLPKRTIAATQMLEWLEEPDEADLA